MQQKAFWLNKRSAR